MIALINDPMQNNPVILKQKFDYLVGCALFERRYADIDLSPDALEKASKIFQLLEPKDVVGYNKQRFGAVGDGGYVLIYPTAAVETNKSRLAYSFGIAFYDPFSTDMANLGYQVFQYDGTVDKSPAEHPLIKFYKFNISGSPNPPPTEKNFKQILDDHGHHGKDIILQIDIEGAEWAFFESLSEEEILHFEQISVELHGFLINKPEELDRCMNVLEKINQTHQCVHLHANNYGHSCILNGFVLLPGTFEVTYLRKKNPVTRKQEYKFTECFKEFPIAGLDTPCCADYPDIYIGRFNYSLDGHNLNEKKEENSFLNLFTYFYQRIVKLHKEFLREKNSLHEEINTLHNETNTLREEIAKKTSLRYFAKKVKEFIRKRINIIIQKIIPLSLKKYRIAIVSGYDQLQPRLYSHKNHKAYAGKHGYAYFFDIGQESHGATLSKIDKILKYIDLYDYLFWIDDDAFFMNQKIKLEDIIIAERELIFCRSPITPEGAFTLLNSGCFFVKNSRKAKKFLLDVFTVDLNLVKNWWKTDYGLFTNTEQDAIFYLLHCGSEYSDDSFFSILDHKYFNSRPFNFHKSFDEYFVCHFPGPGSEKEKKITEFALKFGLDTSTLLPLSCFKSFIKKIYKDT